MMPPFSRLYVYITFMFFLLIKTKIIVYKYAKNLEQVFHLSLILLLKCNNAGQHIYLYIYTVWASTIAVYHQSPNINPHISRKATIKSIKVKKIVHQSTNAMFKGSKIVSSFPTMQLA